MSKTPYKYTDRQGNETNRDAFEQVADVLIALCTLGFLALVIYGGCAVVLRGLLS